MILNCSNKRYNDARRFHPRGLARQQRAAGHARPRGAAHTAPSPNVLRAAAAAVNRVASSRRRRRCAVAGERRCRRRRLCRRSAAAAAAAGHAAPPTAAAGLHRRCAGNGRIVMLNSQLVISVVSCVKHTHMHVACSRSSKVRQRQTIFSAVVDRQRMCYAASRTHRRASYLSLFAM